MPETPTTTHLDYNTTSTVLDINNAYTPSYDNLVDSTLSETPGVPPGIIQEL